MPNEHPKREDCATIQRELFAKSEKNKEQIDLMIGERNSSKLFLQIFAGAVILALFTVANSFVVSTMFDHETLTKVASIEKMVKELQMERK